MKQTSPVAVEVPKPSVHPELSAYHDLLTEQTGLHAVGTKTHSVVGYGGNINFIEGPESIVVVNTGTTLSLSQEALALYRASVSEKPIAALIYTHGYNDHTGGARVFAPNGSEDVAIYASAAWHGFAEQGVSPLMPEVAIRAASQVGWLLPDGPAGTVGNGLTRPVRGAGGASYLAPTVDVSEPRSFDIAGLTLELIPAPHDLDDGLIVWMPDERILFGGDLLLLNDIYPTLATPRSEPRRDPQAWIDSMGVAAAYRPAHLINAYGPPVSGEGEVSARLLGQQRISQYMVDQVHRRVLAGEHADDIAATLTLPDSITRGRNYRETYHRLWWIVRSLISREFGHFGGDVEEFCRLPPHEDAQRMVAAMGGIEAVIALAADAYRSEDFRWSLRLATLALKAAPDDTALRDIRHQSMRAIAYGTDSANERNYLLSAVALETGALDRSALLRQIAGTAPGDLTLVKPPSQLLGVLGRKIRADDSGARSAFSVRFEIIDRDQALDVTVLPAVVLRPPRLDDDAVDLTIALSHAGLVRGVEGMVAWADLRAAGSASVTGEDDVFDLFVESFDW